MPGPIARGVRHNGAAATPGAQRVGLPTARACEDQQRLMRINCDALLLRLV